MDIAFRLGRSGYSEISVGIRVPCRKYFYAPGVYLAGIDMRRLVLLRKLVSALI
jgi:hypothetical protein